MGDRRHSELYTALLSFLEHHGCLALTGVAERGMPAARAIEFIGMLEANEVPVYGIEVWRHGRGGHSVDVTSIWASGTGKNHEYAEARSRLRLANPGPEDLVAVQFG